MLNWLRKANKTGSGYGSGFLGIADEVFAPMKYEVQQDRDRRTSLASPAPRSPENGVQAPDDADVRFAGRIRIDPTIASE